jgi:hypothetical protein
MAKTFDEIVVKEFDFLTNEFGFRLVRCKQIDGGYDVLYLNAVCGVHITYEFREAYLFVNIHALRDGKFVENPRPVKQESVLTGYSLDDILNLRAPDAMMKPAYSYGADSEYYGKNYGLSLFVSKFAENLKTYASDVLSGDFSVFEVIEPVVKKRAQG